MHTMTRRRFIRASTAGSAALGLLSVTGIKVEAASQYACTTLTSPQNLESAVHSIVHRPAGVPILLDGKLLENPEAIAAYNNTPLHYTPLSNRSSVMLAAFTSRHKMIAEAQSLRAQFGSLCQQPPYNLPEQACFFEHMNEEGDVICLPPARACPDLTRVSSGWWSNWNDKISSVSWCRWDVSLYEHIYYGGAELWLPAGCNTTYLEALGWNDRASSIVNWGQRF
jgi:hypothetical protein